MGASVAGLLAARALAEHFEMVTVLEKDACPVHGAPRSGVPQGRHTHILLPSGAQVLERFFPGRLAELVRDGAKKFDYGRSRFYVAGTWLPRVAVNPFAGVVEITWSTCTLVLDAVWTSDTRCAAFSAVSAAARV